ncbi:MAG TPA: PA0069 family radical SAM protein [Phycisphaeraceae bacterium]
MGGHYEYADALPRGALRGRGAGLNPGNRFESVRLHVLGEQLDEAAQQAQQEGQAKLATQVLADHSRTLINRVDHRKSPDIGYDWTINPYRGCEHGCIYCYARPTHEYFGLSCGVDFETRIFAKHDAPELLARELAKPSWRGEPIIMSGVTDPYQPVEARLGITRGCLEIMARCRQPVGLITKNRLVLRDLDLLHELATHRAVSVAVSVTTLDAKLAAKMEPRASSPRDRLAAVARLRAAGVPVRVMMAPIIPGLNDREIPRVLQAAHEAGAMQASYVLLRLPYQLKDLFLEWLKRHVPQRAKHVESLIRDTRNGRLYESAWSVRHRGRGAVAQQIEQVFALFRRRYGLDQKIPPLSSASFRPPAPSNGQLGLFDG